jgi:hypothetical protein
MKKNEIRAEKVDCQINPTCSAMYEGFQYGAGAVLTLPYNLAVEWARQGRVTLLLPENPHIPEDFKKQLDQLEEGSAHGRA